MIYAEFATKAEDTRGRLHMEDESATRSIYQEIETEFCTLARFVSLFIKRRFVRMWAIITAPRD